MKSWAAPAYRGGPRSTLRHKVITLRPTSATVSGNLSLGLSPPMCPPGGAGARTWHKPEKRESLA